ncbi:MAG: YlmC/YmxH family sporulation protein [Firmicutes bacterium]|jgi:YlmC/YmxH family sporulation protein|nr:YlmC/YmxH family sporulation protein [Bacillota bacterium]
MRFSDLAGKELISIDEGARLGIVSETDLVIDTETGVIHSLIVPNRGTFFRRRTLVIPFHGLKKVGHDLIIVDLSTMEDEARYLRDLDLER